MDIASCTGYEPTPVWRVSIVPLVVERRSMALKMQKNSPIRHAELACFVPENGRARSGKPGKILEKIEKNIPTTSFIRGFWSLSYQRKTMWFPTNCKNFKRKFQGEGGLRGPKPHSCVPAKIFFPIYFLTSKRLEIFAPFFDQHQTPSIRTNSENFVTITPKMGAKKLNN